MDRIAPQLQVGYSVASQAQLQNLANNSNTLMPPLGYKLALPSSAIQTVVSSKYKLVRCLNTNRCGIYLVTTLLMHLKIRFSCKHLWQKWVNSNNSSELFKNYFFTIIIVQQYKLNSRWSLQYNFWIFRLKRVSPFLLLRCLYFNLLSIFPYVFIFSEKILATYLWMGRFGG